MQVPQRTLPFSRIRIPRTSSDPRAITAELHRSAHLIAYAQPAYPPEALARGIEGNVTLDIIIGKDGAVRSLSVRDGDPLLAESAMQTVRHWAYRPTLVNGIPVEVQTEVEVSFSAPGQTAS